MRRWIVSVAVWTMAFGAVAAGRAQTTNVSNPMGPPDVVVIVYQQPGKSALVDMTYSHTVPHTQAQNDEAALAQAMGATIGAGKVTDGEAPVQRKMGPMTGIVFTVPNLIPDDSHTLPVEPFIVALRQYKRLALIFSVGTGVPFQPLGNYADKNVQVAMAQHGLVYTYQVDVLNPHFEHLNLPQSPAMTPALAVAESRHSRLWALYLGLVTAAMAAGVLVYVLMARNTPLPSAQNETAEALSEEKTHIGTKG